MRPWLKGCLVVAGLLLVVVGLSLVLVGPTAVREGRRFAMPVIAMVSEARKFEEFVEKNRWSAPAVETVTAEQLERFLALRGRLDALYARLAPRLANLSEDDPESLDEAAEAVGLFGDLVPEQMKAFMEAKTTPKEYRYLEEVIHSRWWRGLKAQGAAPGALEVAARELEAAADAESDPAVAARLRERAAGLRTSPAPPPEGVSQEIHDLLLPRVGDIERLSLDAYQHLQLPEM